jgi:twitching motility two-component system response regulator PilH
MTINKVLLVDDSPTDLANIRNIVTDAGYSVVTASSGNEAIKIAKTEMPDLIFMDIVMEGADGYEACREISQDGGTKNIPVVFVTSKNQKADRVWAELQGGKAFITKPYTSDQIIDQIAAIA